MIFTRLHSIHAVLTFSNGETWPSYNGGKLYHRLLCIYDHMPDYTLGIASYINTLRPRQDGRHFPDDTFKCIFLNENIWITITISLKFVPKGPINNIPAMVQIMAWRRPGDKPLSEPMVVSLPTHICVARPQWVKYYIYMISNSKMHLSMPHGSEYHYHHQGSFCACTHPMRECRLLLDRRIRKMIPASCTFPWWTKARWSNMQHHDTYGFFIDTLHAKRGIYWLYYALNSCWAWILMGVQFL